MDILVLLCGDALKQQESKQVSCVIVWWCWKMAEWLIHTTMWLHLGMACV